MSNETRADIIREMRDLAALDAQCGDMIPRSLLALGLRTYADRLEAAAERERIQRDKVSFRCGDCARFGGDCDAGDIDGNEDCVACEKFVRRALVHGNGAARRGALEKILEIATRCGNRDGRDGTYSIARIADAALAAPPRNCDRFSRGVDAVSAYYEKGGFPITVVGCDFADWLLAPAEGKEAHDGQA